jgi:hypothetical protein
MASGGVVFAVIILILIAILLFFICRKRIQEYMIRQAGGEPIATSESIADPASAKSVRQNGFQAVIGQCVGLVNLGVALVSCIHMLLL